MSGIKQGNLLPFEKVKRTLYVKKQSETSPKFGCKPEERSTEVLLHYGIVNIDKPRGPTSHQVSAYVKQILKLKRCGHSGTLDPQVTGVLPVALDKATKIVQALLTAGKEYVCLMYIHRVVPLDKLVATCQAFVGKIDQLPPQKSSVKRQWRQRSVYYLNILEVEGRYVLFRVGCEAGTYIRKLCTDIGKKLGVNAQMVELRRTKVAMFDESTLCTLQDVADAFYYYREEGNDKYLRFLIKPVEYGVQHLPKIWVLDTTVNSLCHGSSLKVPGISKLESGIEDGSVVALMTLKNELIALGKARMSSQDIMQSNRGVAAMVDSVFMAPQAYPRMDPHA